MESSFRIAIGMLFLVGTLQANPIGKHRQARSTEVQGLECNSGDLHGIEKVVCADNMNFTSITNVEDSCIDAALNTFIEGLELAKTNCTDASYRIPDILPALKDCKDLVQAKESTECKWEKSSKNFTGFVKDLKSLVQQINGKVANQN